jgi:hypothetical protein
VMKALAQVITNMATTTLIKKTSLEWKVQWQCSQNP